MEKSKFDLCENCWEKFPIEKLINLDNANSKPEKYCTDCHAKIYQ